MLVYQRVMDGFDVEPRQAKDLKDVTTEDPASLAACCALLEWSYKHLSNTKLLTCPHSWRSDGFSPSGPIATLSLPVVFATLFQGLWPQLLLPAWLCTTAIGVLQLWNLLQLVGKPWKNAQSTPSRSRFLPGSRWSSEPDELVRSACIRFLAISTQHTLLPRPA